MVEKILIVEDEAIIAKDLQGRISKMGYVALEPALTPEEADEAIRRHAPDLILMDIVLESKLSGVQLAGQVREKHDIPVVFLSAYSDEKTLQQAIETEPYGYLIKPFQEKELYTTIRMALYKHKIEKRLRQSESWLRTTFRSLSEIIIVTTAEGQINFVNRAARNYSGWKSLEIAGKDLSTLIESSSGPLPLEAALQKQRTLILSGEPVLLTREGKRIAVSGNLSPILEPDGSCLGFIVVLHDITEAKVAEEKWRQTNVKLQQSLEATIRAMAMIIEIRDPYTAVHQRQVARLASLIAGEMGLKEELLTGISLAALIHDLGKINIPAEILNKSGEISDNERALLKTHPTVGYNILKSINFPWPIADIVLQHHEYLDGSGYPKGLQGDSILIEARILSVADLLEAMTAHRPYRASQGVEAALAEIRKYRGTRYDPVVVDVCLKLHHAGKFVFLKS